MSIGDAIGVYIEESGESHRGFAKRTGYERSMVSKVVAGDRKWPQTQDSNLAKIDPYLAWAVGYERTAGFIPPPPVEIDQNYALIKDRLVVELEEVQESLKKVARFFRMTEEEQREVAEETWLEIDDAIREALHLQSYIMRKYGIEPEKLRKRRGR